jgi:hypothetical protein
MEISHACKTKSENARMVFQNVGKIDNCAMITTNVQMMFVILKSDVSIFQRAVMTTICALLMSVILTKVALTQRLVVTIAFCAPLTVAMLKTENANTLSIIPNALLLTNALLDTAQPLDANSTRTIPQSARFKNNHHLAIYAKLQMLAKFQNVTFNLIFLLNALPLRNTAMMERNVPQILATLQLENASILKL